jgi:polar amino acid transport system substrate-binding protein
MKKLWSLFIMSILLISILAACGTGAEKETDEKDAAGGSKSTMVLKMGTSADYAPFEYIDTEGTGDFMGIDIEIAQAITENLGYELKIQDMDFGGLIAALQNGQVDFVMSAMSADEDRKKNADFSEVYYESKHFIVSKKGSGFETIEDLAGKKVAAQMGSVQEDKGGELAEEVGFSMENRNRVPELLQEIMAGRLDAAIIEDTVAKGYLAENKEIEGFTIEDVDGGYAIAFPKGSELREEFNAELQKMLESGEIDTIIKKYFEQ